MISDVDRVRDQLPDRTTLARAVRGALEGRLGIDPRALAAFRIAVGLLVFVDLLVYRLPGVEPFYTDDGVFPRSALAETYPAFETVSIHALSGSSWFQYLLFALAAVFALSLLVGYRTRLAAAVSFLLLASMQARNPLVLNGGDTILLSVLFLSLFLPLERRWSLDARRGSLRSQTDRTTGSDRVLSLATAAVTLHIVVLYATNAVLKFQSESWMDGTAVGTAFHTEQYLMGIGPSLAEFPAVLAATNWLWTAVISLSVLLLVFTGWLRLVVVLALAGAHLGMAATMWLGIFPFVMIASVMLFVPPKAWDRLEYRLRATNAWDRLVAERSVPISVAPASSSVFATRRFSSTFRRTASRIGAVIVICAFVLLVTVHAAQLGLGGPTAQLDEELGESGWSFFAPNPPDDAIDYALAGELESGETVDLVRGGEPELDRPPDPGTTFSSTLWQRYGIELRYAGESQYKPLISYVCEQSEQELESVTVYFLEQPVGPDGPVDEPVVHERASSQC